MTVAICSQNGERMLSEVIEAAKTSLHSAGGGRLLLVDSASTDRTSQVMRAAGGADVLTVSTPGQSRARNAALAASQGTLVLFTDDDVIVPARWVSDLSAPLRSGASAVSGVVHLAEEIAGDLGPYERELLADTRHMNIGDPPRTIVGASMGVAQDVVDRGFTFDEHLGPGALGFLDDTLMQMQISEAGGRTACVGSSPVVHHPDTRRLDEKAWLARAAKQGICEAWVAHHWLHERPEPLALRAALAHGRRDLRGTKRTAAARWWLRHGLDKRHYARRAVPARLDSPA